MIARFLQRRWLVLAVFGLAVAGTNSETAEANLLVNPGFENPVLVAGDSFGSPGWTDFGGGTFTIKQAPHSGDNAFKMFGGTSGIYQEFPASVGQIWNGGAWILNPSFDAMQPGQIAAVNIEWHSDSGLISFISNGLSDASQPTGSLPADYVFRTVTGPAPAGTTKARFVLITGNFAGPGGGAPFYDDAFFELIPEPTSMALASLGLLGILGARRRNLG